MSYNPLLEKSFILNRKGDVLLEHPGWISSISTEGVVLLEGEESGEAALYHIASGARYELPREVASKRVYWHPSVAPQGGKCIGYCIKPSCRGACNLNPQYSPEGQIITDSFAVDMQGNVLFEPLPLFLNPYATGEETIAEDRRHRISRVNGKGETTFAYPAEWRYAGKLPVEGTEGAYEIRLRPKNDKDNDGPYHIAGFNMEWLCGPFESVEGQREGLRCVRDNEDESAYFVNAAWLRCLEAPKGYMFDMDGVQHGHISYHPANNYSSMGLMNKAGDVIFKPRYSEMWHIEGPYWWYKKKGSFGILHESGVELTPPIIGQAYRIWDDEIPHGLVSAARKGTSSHRCGIINMQGEWVIEPRYGRVSSFLHPEYTTAQNWKK